MQRNSGNWCAIAQGAGRTRGLLFRINKALFCGGMEPLGSLFEMNARFLIESRQISHAELIDSSGRNQASLENHSARSFIWPEAISQFLQTLDAE